MKGAIAGSQAIAFLQTPAKFSQMSPATCTTYPPAGRFIPFGPSRSEEVRQLRLCQSTTKLQRGWRSLIITNNPCLLEDQHTLGARPQYFPPYLAHTLINQDVTSIFPLKWYRVYIHSIRRFLIYFAQTEWSNHSLSISLSNIPTEALRCLYISAQVPKQNAHVSNRYGIYVKKPSLSFRMEW